MNATMHNTFTSHAALVSHGETISTSGYLPIPASESGMQPVPTDSLFYANGVLSIIGDIKGNNGPVTHAEFQTWEGILNQSADLQELVVNALMNPAMIGHPEKVLADLDTALINLSSPYHTDLPVQLIGYSVFNNGHESVWITG